jgi:hypothetical protein
MKYKDYLKDFIGKQGRMTKDVGVFSLDLQSSVIDAEIVGVEDDFIILRQSGYNARGKQTFINHAIPLSAFRLIETVIEK